MPLLVHSVLSTGPLQKILSCYPLPSLLLPLLSLTQHCRSAWPSQRSPIERRRSRPIDKQTLHNLHNAQRLPYTRRPVPVTQIPMRTTLDPRCSSVRTRTRPHRCRRTCLQQIGHCRPSMRRHERRIRQPPRQICLETELVDVTLPSRLARLFIHDARAVGIRTIKAPLRRRNKAIRALRPDTPVFSSACPSRRGRHGQVMHHRGAVKVNRHVVTPPRMIEASTILPAVYPGAIIDVEVLVNQTHTFGPFPHFLRPGKVRRVARVPSQPGRKLEEAAVRNGIFIVPPCAGGEDLPS